MVFAKQHNIDYSLAVQRAITKMSECQPSEEEIPMARGDTACIPVSLSDTAIRLLELWSEQTDLSKSKLITYSIEKTIIEQGGV